jgi:hypothetical protein
MTSTDLVVNLVMENDETLIKTYCYSDGTELNCGLEQEMHVIV